MPRITLTLLFAFALMRPDALAQDKPAYRLFDSSGVALAYGTMLDSLLEADAVFFGEQHNNPIAHWLQLELARDLHAARGDSLVLGAEMFEADNQLLLDEFLAGTIPARNFEQEARLWNNYPTDYKPLVELAATQGLAFIATNVPRRYANLVFREGLAGLDSLSEAARQYLPPLPIAFDPELPGYRAMLEMMGGHAAADSSDANLNFPMAQAIKDATMAYFIDRNLPAGSLFLHFNGAYHSDNFEGIVWYLRRGRPELGIRTITTIEQDSVRELEEGNRGKADFILAVPATMTKTY